MTEPLPFFCDDITAEDIEAVPKARLDQFWSQVDRSLGPDGCWPWTKSTKGGLQNGYGRFQINKRHFLTHRLAFALIKGPILYKRLVCHHCDYKRCCNPTHLFLGTNADNLADFREKGGYQRYRGAGNPRAKLDPHKVRIIRRLSARGIDNCQLALRFNVDSSTIDRVMNGKRWGHVS